MYRVLEKYNGFFKVVNVFSLCRFYNPWKKSLLLVYINWKSLRQMIPRKKLSLSRYHLFWKRDWPLVNVKKSESSSVKNALIQVSWIVNVAVDNCFCLIGDIREKGEEASPRCHTVEVHAFSSVLFLAVFVNLLKVSNFLSFQKSTLYLTLFTLSHFN